MCYSSLIPALLTVVLACVPRTAQSSSDPIEDCYRENFPLALGLPQAMIPKEVRFYCAAPWDMKAMQSVRRALDRAKFDQLGATIRLSSSTPDSMAAKMASKALSEADKGPPATLGTMYRVRFALPMMHALHFQTRDAKFVQSRMHPIDVQALINAAKSVDWNMPALHAGKPISKSSRLSSAATLADAASFIVLAGGK